MEKEIYGYIYRIRNTVNEKVYIGLTTKCFDRRYDTHGEGIERVYHYHANLRKRGKYYNIHLLNSIEKYGFEAFEVIKEFDIAYSEEELKEKEKYWISFYKCNDDNYGYNRTEGGDGIIGLRGENNPFYGKHHSEETRRKWSENRRGENHPMYGKHLSEEARNRISECMRGKEGTKNNNAKLVVAIFPDGRIIKDVCMKELAKDLGVSQYFVRSILRSKKPYKMSKKTSKSDYERLKPLEGIIIMSQEDYLNINDNDKAS